MASLQGRAAALAGPGARGAFLEIAGERALDWRLLGSRPAWAAPSRTSKRGCAVRSGLSKGPGQVAGEHSFVRGLGEACAKGQRRPVALAALRKESPMTDLITAARDGNGPRVEVAPPHGSCGIQGPGPVSMLLPLRRVNARIPVSWSQLSSWPLLISFYAGAPERCRQGWQSPGNPSR